MTRFENLSAMELASTRGGDDGGSWRSVGLTAAGVGLGLVYCLLANARRERVYAADRLRWGVKPDRAYWRRITGL